MPEGAQCLCLVAHVQLSAHEQRKLFHTLGKTKVVEPREGLLISFLYEKEVELITLDDVRRWTH